MLCKIQKTLLITSLLCWIQLSLETSLDDMGQPEQMSAKVRNQLLIDVSMLKNSLSQLQSDFNLLNSRLDSQTVVIRNFKSQRSQHSNLYEQCEMGDLFEDLDVKLTKIKQKIQRTVNENDDEHMDKLDKIMHNAKKATHDCSATENDELVALKAKMTQKLLEFDGLMAKMKTLEEKLTKPPQQQVKTSTASVEVTNLLTEIHAKLEAQQKRLVNLETIIPEVEAAARSWHKYEENRKMACNKKKCISQKILELTKL